MKLHLLNPNMRYISSFYFRRQGLTVLSPDNHVQYVLSGSASITISGTTSMLYRDTLIYYPKGTIYELNSLSENCKLISLNFDCGQDEYLDTEVRVPQPYVPNSETPTDHMLSEIAENDSFLSYPISFYNAQEYLPYLLRILDEFRRAMPYSRNLCSCILKELLIMLHYTSQNTSSNNRQAIREILDYIENNYMEPLTNESLADRFGYHPNYLCRLFKSSIQTSPRQYILQTRLAQAKKLISETALSLTEISSMVGFQDYPYFSSYFKKKTGLTPSSYRNQSQGNI